MNNNLTIDNITLNGRVILAPMAGITSFSYRKFYKKFNPALTMTEMISDCGLIYGNKNTFLMAYSNKEDAPLSLQLFGGKEETLTQAIKILEDKNFYYDFLDINLACPVPKVTKSNGGSSWLKDLNSLKKMMTNVVETSKKPVTAKIRLGWDKNEVSSISKVLEDSGVKFLEIHCRTKNQGYSGTPDYDALKNLKKEIKIPFGVSGNIFSLDDAKKAYEITKCDAILVARGAIGNPLLIAQINDYFEGKESNVNYNYKKQKEFLYEYASLLKEEVGEKRATSILKGIAPKFFQFFENSKLIRQELTLSLKSYEDLYKILDSYE